MHTKRNKKTGKRECERRNKKENGFISKKIA